MAAIQKHFNKKTALPLHPRLTIRGEAMIQTKDDQAQQVFW
jgi:hypothetical protein